MQRYGFFLNLQALGRFFFEKSFRSSREGSSFLFHEEKKRSKENSPATFPKLLSLKPRGLFISFSRKKETKQRKFAGCTSEAFSLKPRGLFISFPRRKETKQRKFAGYVPEAKICTFFLKKKNSLRSNSFFFLTENAQISSRFSTHAGSCWGGWLLNVASLVFWGALRMVAERCFDLLGMYSDPSSLHSSG